jgi:hypothetical protein
MPSRDFDPARDVRRRITAGLILSGALGGGVVGLLLTEFGKIVAGAEPATLSNYLWNIGIFAAVGAINAPLVIWTWFRRAPLWRAIAEPVLGAVAGAGIGVLLGSGAVFLLLTPIGAMLAAARLAKSQERLASRSGQPHLPDPRSPTRR